LACTICRTWKSMVACLPEVVSYQEQNYSSHLCVWWHFFSFSHIPEIDVAVIFLISKPWRVYIWLIWTKIKFVWQLVYEPWIPVFVKSHFVVTQVKCGWTDTPFILCAVWKEHAINFSSCRTIKRLQYKAGSYGTLF
jgi:hypothetical protein